MESKFSNTHAITVLSSDNPGLYQAFVEHFQLALFDFLGRMGFSQADAEDIAQDVFLKAWRYRTSYNPTKAKVSTWLFTIARNTALSKLKSSQPAPIPLHEIEIKATPHSQPEQQLQKLHAKQLLSLAIQQLPIDDRSAIALFYIDDLSTEQAATILQCSTSAFKTRLSRARNKLRAIYDELENTQ